MEFLNFLKLFLSSFIQDKANEKKQNALLFSFPASKLGSLYMAFGLTNAGFYES